MGGVTSIIIAFPTTKVCINMKKFQNIFYAFFAMKYLFANIKLNLLFIYNNFLQYSTKNTNFVLVKILFMKKRNSNQKCCKFYFERIYEIIWEKHKKRWPANGHLFGEGIFCYLLGVAKLYNVLGGVTSIIIALGHPKVCIKF